MIPDFKGHLYLLQSIQLSGSLDLIVKTREITAEEINDLIKNSQYEDLSF
jgi:hypothetical protein